MDGSRRTTDKELDAEISLLEADTDRIRLARDVHKGLHDKSSGRSGAAHYNMSFVGARRDACARIFGAPIGARIIKVGRP